MIRLVKLTLLIIIFENTLPYDVSGLKCFLCSETQGNPCPTQTDDAKSWSSEVTHYGSVGAATTHSCAVGFSDSGKVYLQSGVPITMCTSQEYQSIVTSAIIHEGGTNPNVTCCSKDGCNWNATTAEKNLDYGEITSTWFYIPDIVNWTPIIFGIIVAIIVFFCIIALCCYLICCRSKSKKKKKAYSETDKSLDPNHNKLQGHQNKRRDRLGYDQPGADPLRHPDPWNAPPTPSKLIGVRPRKNSQEINQTPREKKKPASQESKSVESTGGKINQKSADAKKDEHDQKKKNLFDKEQSEWVDIWKRANDPKHKGPLKTSKK